jgi:thioredoxin 1
MHPVLRDVAAALGDKAKVIKIDVEKNGKLAEALRVRGLPTLMIYKEGEMKWRQSGEQDANTLIGIVKEYINS